MEFLSANYVGGFAHEMSCSTIHASLAQTGIKRLEFVLKISNFRMTPFFF